MAEPQSRNESILQAIIDGTQYTDPPQSRIEDLLLQVKEVIEGGSGTTDYEDLENKPSINNVELFGDKSLSDLGVASEGAVAAKASQSDIAPTFSDATAYTVGDVVYYEGSLYRFTADHSAGAWDSTDVEIVTVDDLVDGLKPVDSVTDGDMRPVTSNAVYEYLNNSVTVTRNEGETVKSFFNRAYAAIDMTKLTPFTKLVTGTNSVFPIGSWNSSEINFLKSTLYESSASMYEQLSYLRLHATNSASKYVNFSTSAKTGSGSSVGWTIGDQTESTTSGPSSITIYYR